MTPLEIDNDGNYSEDDRCFVAGLCYFFSLLTEPKKPKEYVCIDEVVQFVSVGGAGIIRRTSYYNDDSLLFR